MSILSGPSANWSCSVQRFDQMFHVSLYVNCFNTWEQVRDLIKVLASVLVYDQSVDMQNQRLCWVIYTILIKIRANVWINYIIWKSLIDLITFKEYSISYCCCDVGNRYQQVLGVCISSKSPDDFRKRCRLCSLTHVIYGWYCTVIICLDN